MAIRVPTIVVGQNKSVITTWEGFLTSADSGTPSPTGGFKEVTIQMLGNIGTGGVVSMEGSNDGSTWVILEDKQGDVVTFSAIGLMTSIQELPLLIRPNCTAGSGATDLDIFMLAVY